jgi:hypothetical protein
LRRQRAALAHPDLDPQPETTSMAEVYLQLVHAARERALAKAAEFFGSLRPEESEALPAPTHECGAGQCPPIDRAQIGTIYEQNGWMPKADYLEMERIISAFNAGMPTSDAKFDTMLRLLREGKEAIVRARVLAFLGELVKRDESGPARVAQIEEAIAPCREGLEDLDTLYWAFVRAALDAHSAELPR